VEQSQKYHTGGTITCGIFGIVPPVCYFWDCSTSVVFLGLFHQCGIFGIVPPVLYFWDKNTTLVENPKTPHWWNNPKNTTLVKQSQILNR
jgi:hypothetical protein